MPDLHGGGVPEQPTARERRLDHADRFGVDRSQDRNELGRAAGAWDAGGSAGGQHRRRGRAVIGADTDHDRNASALAQRCYDGGSGQALLLAAQQYRVGPQRTRGDQRVGDVDAHLGIDVVPGQFGGQR
ncbi:MAG TPA: hypothetical protein VI011_01365 [Asanoa sp.]